MFLFLNKTCFNLFKFLNVSKKNFRNMYVIRNSESLCVMMLNANLKLTSVMSDVKHVFVLCFNVLLKYETCFMFYSKIYVL